jgi:hypothetical protein
VRRGHARLVRILLDASSKDVAAKRSDGWTALQLITTWIGLSLQRPDWAVLRGHEDVARLLRNAEAAQAAPSRRFRLRCSLRCLRANSWTFAAVAIAAAAAAPLSSFLPRNEVLGTPQEWWWYAVMLVVCLLGVNLFFLREAAASREAAEREGERILEGARTEAAAIQEAAFVAAERKSARMLEAARLGVGESRREAAAIKGAAEREREGMLEAARLEVEEARREAAAILGAARVRATGERARMFELLELLELEAARLGARREAAATQEAAERESARMLEELVATLAVAQQESRFCQGGSVERLCVICLSEPRTVRFGCGHSTLCGGCLGHFLARGGGHARCPLCRAAVVRAQIEQGAHVALQDSFVPRAPAAVARGANGWAPVR